MASESAIKDRLWEIFLAMVHDHNIDDILIQLRTEFDADDVSAHSDLIKNYWNQLQRQNIFAPPMRYEAPVKEIGIYHEEGDVMKHIRADVTRMLWDSDLKWIISATQQQIRHKYDLDFVERKKVIMEQAWKFLYQMEEEDEEADSAATDLEEGEIR